MDGGNDVGHDGAPPLVTFLAQALEDLGGGKGMLQQVIARALDSLSREEHTGSSRDQGPHRDSARSPSKRC